MRQYTDGAGRDDFERVFGDGDNRLLDGLRRVRMAYRIERGDGARNET